MIRRYSLQPEDEEANRSVLQEENRVEQDIVKFREGGYRAAVSTAILNAGVDLPLVEVVLHLDAPSTPTVYG